MILQQGAVQHLSGVGSSPIVTLRRWRADPPMAQRNYLHALINVLSRSWSVATNTERIRARDTKVIAASRRSCWYLSVRAHSLSRAYGQSGVKSTGLGDEVGALSSGLRAAATPKRSTGSAFCGKCSELIGARVAGRGCRGATAPMCDHGRALGKGLASEPRRRRGHGRPGLRRDPRSRGRPAPKGAARGVRT